MNSLPAIRILRIAVLAALTVGAGWVASSAQGESYFKNGFKVGPNYRRPAAPIAPAWIEGDNPRVHAGVCPEDLWWRSFNDPVLTSLIETAYRQSLTLRSAGMRILQARAQREIAAGNLFPQRQEAFGSYTRIAQSQEIANRNSLGRQRFFSDWLIGGQFVWELDFWGRFRRSVAAADARLDAQIEAYDDVLLILISDVASVYVEIRALDQRIEFARQNFEIQNESARLAAIKQEAGARESELDLPQARSNLAEIEALIPQLELRRRQAMNQLSVLLGMPPADLTGVLGRGVIPVPPPDMAVGIPADLLRRRPDVRRSERELAAQSEEIGIAVTDLYPHLTINGTIFLEAERFGDLFSHNAWGGSVGPAFRWDVLNYGRLRANIRREEARFGELLYDYQQTVLQANREAEDAIAQYLYSHEIVSSLQAGADASLEGVRIASTRYQDGVTDFNRLSNLQLFVARQQDALAVAQGQIAQGWIAVYRSLGGGWQLRLAPPTGDPSQLPPIVQPEAIEPPDPSDEPTAELAPPQRREAEPPAELAPEQPAPQIARAVPSAKPLAPETAAPLDLPPLALEPKSPPQDAELRAPEPSITAPTAPESQPPSAPIGPINLANPERQRIQDPSDRPVVLVPSPRAAVRPEPVEASIPTTLQPQIAPTPAKPLPVVEARPIQLPPSSVELAYPEYLQPRHTISRPLIEAPEPELQTPTAEQLLIVLSHPDSLRVQRSAAKPATSTAPTPRATAPPMQISPIAVPEALPLVNPSATTPTASPLSSAPISVPTPESVADVALSFPATMSAESRPAPATVGLAQPSSVAK